MLIGMKYIIVDLYISPYSEKLLNYLQSNESEERKKEIQDDTKKQELLKNSTKIEEIKEKKNY
jgi:hypothetical protein